MWWYFILSIRVTNTLNECQRISLAINQDWFGWWIGAVSQQAITWTRVDLDCRRYLVMPLSYNEITVRNLSLLLTFNTWCFGNRLLIRYVKLRFVQSPGMPGTFSPLPLVNDPNMHHDRCITHVPRCIRDSYLAVSFEVVGGENVPGIPGACATRNFTYLVRGPWVQHVDKWLTHPVPLTSYDVRACHMLSANQWPLKTSSQLNH